MATVSAVLTPAEFDRMPGVEDRKIELLDGELIEMPSASGPHNFLLIKLAARLEVWLESHDAGVIIADTEFAIGQSRLRPDLAFLSVAKWERIATVSVPLPEPPEIAIEIISPSESAITLDRKVAAYLDAGVQEVWGLYHESERLFIHTSRGITRLDRDSIIETPLLPGWALALSELLRKKNNAYR